jgi:predicted Zn-dependent protease
MRIRAPRRALVALCAATLFIAGCTSVMQVATSVGESSGYITSQQAQSINRTAAAVEKTFQDITPEQEHFVGRAVAATVLHLYKPYDLQAANRYLSVLGQTLALCSNRPETFGGYHFLIIDSDEVNAFAAPGGLILVTRGLIRCCTTEDMLAAVVAHEIGHVEGKHGLRAIKTGRLNSALTTIGIEAGKNLGSEELASVTQAFEEGITDISATLMNSGYSRGLEREADLAAVRILRKAGYDPHALVQMLEQMQARMRGDVRGFGRTHPSPTERIRALAGAAGTVAAVPQPTRQRRFQRAMAGI